MINPRCSLAFGSSDSMRCATRRERLNVPLAFTFIRRSKRASECTSFEDFSNN